MNLGKKFIILKFGVFGTYIYRSRETCIKKELTLVKSNTVMNFKKNKIPKKYWGEVFLTALHLINYLSYAVIVSKIHMEVLSSLYLEVPTFNKLIPNIFECTY